MAIGDDFLTNPTSALYLDKVPTGRALPTGLSDQNVSKAENWNAIKNAMGVIRNYVLLPLEAKGTPPENVVPNSEWQLLTLTGAGPKVKADATGFEDAITVASYSTSSNTAVCQTSDTKNLKVGDLVKFDASAHANLQIAPMRVTSVTVNTSFNVGIPRGLTGVTTAACTCQPWDAGGDSLIGTGDGPDGWSKTTGAMVWREDNTVNLKPGARYACGFKKYSVSRENLYVIMPTREVYQFRGKSFVFGCGVMQKIKAGAGTWRLWVNVDGVEVFSAYATAQTYQWLEKTLTIADTAAAISYGISFEGSLSDVYYVTQPMAGVGDYLGDWNYSRVRNEYFIPKVQFNPATMVGATVSMPATPLASSDNTVAHGGGVGNQFGFKMRLPAESGGRIAPTVRAIQMQLEAKSADTLLPRSNAFVDLLLECTTGGAKGTAAFRVSANAGSTWSTIQVSDAVSATIQWLEATYSGDANNASVRYQPFNLAAGTYTAGDRWSVTTAAVVTQTVAVGFNGVTVTPRNQTVVLGLRSKDAAPTIYGILLFAQAATLMNGHAGLVTLDEFGDMIVYSGSLSTTWTSVSYDINGFWLS